jgi:nitroreductase
MGLFEAMYSQRAIRFLKPDPIPDELVEKVIEAGIRAPNGGNTQGWGFVVIKDPDVKKKMGPLYQNVGRPDHGAAQTWSEKNSASSAEYLGDHIAEVPVWILACTKNAGNDISTGASIYPAVQNMLLAARALGLGSVLTTRVRRGYESQMREWIGLPEGWVTAAMIPLGWPMEGHNYGPTNRKPAALVTHWEKWGEQR